MGRRYIVSWSLKDDQDFFCTFSRQYFSMKQLLLIPLLGLFNHLQAQEMESDLFATLNSNTLAIFMKTEFATMTVVTYRSSTQLGLVEENTTRYRKGKINPDRINFNIDYTEYFMLDDRKKSIGRYDLGLANEVIRYERTDFNQRNIRTYTYYHFYTYNSQILEREFIRNKEYIGTGSAELDTVVTLDSVNYKITAIQDGFQQQDLAEGGAATVYHIENSILAKKARELTGFREENIFVYDAKGQLVSIQNILIGEDGQRISNFTKIRYTIDGLITEVIFLDQNNEVLEKKVFSYK